MFGTLSKISNEFFQPLRNLIVAEPLFKHKAKDAEDLFWGQIMTASILHIATNHSYIVDYLNQDKSYSGSMPDVWILGHLLAAAASGKLFWGAFAGGNKRTINRLEKKRAQKEVKVSLG